MGPVKVSDLKVKVCIELDSREQDVAVAPLEVSEITDKELFLKNDIMIEALSKVLSLKIYFDVCGNWKSYDVLNVRLPENCDNYGKVSSLLFDLPEEQKFYFTRDLSVARIS